MPLYSPAKMYILLYEKMSIYLCQKMYKQSYLLQQLLTQAGEFWQYFGNFAKMIIFAEYGV